MSPAKKKASGNYVLTGRSATVTFGLQDSDETFTMERGTPTEVPAEFVEQVEATAEIYPEGEVPDGAILGQPLPEEPALDEPADEAAPAPIGNEESLGAPSGEGAAPAEPADESGDQAQA